MAGTRVADLHPSPSQKAKSLLEQKPLLLAPFTDTGMYARTLKRAFPGTALQNADAVALRAAVLPTVRSDLEAWTRSNPLGMTSLSDMFRTVNPAWKDAWIQRFNAMMDDPAFYTIVDFDGRTGAPNNRVLTLAERAQLKVLAADFFTKLIPALAAEDVRLLASVSGKVDLVDGTAGDALLAAMNATSQTYLNAKTGTSLAATVNNATLALPLFRYDWTLRRDASRLMRNRSSDAALWWGTRDTEAIKADFTSLLNDTVKASGGTFDSSGVSSGFASPGTSNAAYQWYLENQHILNGGF